MTRKLYPSHKLSASLDVFQCAFVSDVADCAGHPCKHGTCKYNGFNTFICQCSTGYDGIFCDTGIYDCKTGTMNKMKLGMAMVAIFTCHCSTEITQLM